MGINQPFRRDKFYRDRDSYAEWWTIGCSACAQKVLLYQKDGHGKLYRCYLNRIFAPSDYANLQYDSRLTVKKLPNLVCAHCKNLLGIPMLHWEGRLAFRLIKGRWVRRKAQQSDEWKI